METQVRDALIGRVVDARYRVDARVARGGMATVYEALDLRLERVVALKVMHPALAEDPGFVSRFEREAKSAARLSHPNVVSVYDQGVDGDIVFLTMEFVPGRTLRDVLREHGALTPTQALIVLEPVLDALAAAHRAGFVHRDIKPENVLISDAGTVMVADFGLARAITTSGATATATQGMLIGTVAYLSPEQVERGVADARSDVYGAGILLYEMLTGSVPHGGESPLAVAYQHVNADVPAPSTIRAGIPAEADALVALATRRDPDERFGSAEEFAAAARAARAGMPAATPLRDTAVIPAAPPAPEKAPRTRAARPPKPPKVPKPPKAPRQRRQRRWAGPLILVLALLLAFGGGAAAWWLGSARTVPVPQVVGLTEAAAKQRLAGADLGLTVASRQFSETVKSGLIISSDPARGADARVGSSVAVVLSKGPERYAVPDVAGESVSAATARLADDTIGVAGEREVYHEEIEAGLVVGTDPEPGTSVRRSAEVFLLVSKGPKPVPMPGVVGDDKETAIAAIEGAGLKAEITTEYSERYAQGLVMSADPPTGTELVRGSTVTIVVSDGPPPVIVPNVVDLDRDAAVGTLKGLGFKVSVEEPLGVTALNRVLRQTPAAGTELPKGSTVTIELV